MEEKMKKIKSLLIVFISIITSAYGQDQTAEPQFQTSSPFNQAKFVPDISFITDFSFVSRDIDNELYSQLHIPGFMHHSENGEHEGFNSKKGFNLNYGELTLYSIVDPYFDLFAVLHVAQEHAGLEEVYFTTRKLPYGFQLKAGKFLSSFGKINEQHAHYLDFAERPLVLTSFFGDEGLNELGVRLTWIAPTDFYLMLGAEVLTGENEASFGKAGFADPSGIVNIHAIENPSLIVGYAKSSFDIREAAILIGASVAQGTTRRDENFSSSDGNGEALDASTTIFGADLTVKYTPDAIRILTFQSEYLYRTTNGHSYLRDTLAVTKSSFDQNQSGFYAQLVAKTGLRWRLGLRYDLLQLNDIKSGGVLGALPKNLPRYSAMLEYSPTEFSRFRLQLTHDKTKYFHTDDGILHNKPYTEILLQCTIGIGAHGAHSF